MHANPALARGVDPDANLAFAPVPAEAEMFVSFIILHPDSSFYAMRAELAQEIAAPGN